MSGIFEDLTMYFFDRNDFCEVFMNVFDMDEIENIKSLCASTTHLNSFSLFYHNDEFYILHRNSGIMINWYKHLGRTNTCNFDGMTLEDLEVFLKALKEDIDDID